MFMMVDCAREMTYKYGSFEHLFFLFVGVVTTNTTPIYFYQQRYHHHLVPMVMTIMMAMRFYEAITAAAAAVAAAANDVDNDDGDDDCIHDCNDSGSNVAVVTLNRLYMCTDKMKRLTTLGTNTAN